MPYIGNAPNSAKPAFKKMLIDQSTLPNSNLSPSEINKINDMHNQILNQQLAKQLHLSQEMTDGTAFRETHSSLRHGREGIGQLKKPPLILSNKLALKKQRRRELLNAGAMLNPQMGAQDRYRQAGLFIDRSVPALNSRMQGGSRMYDAPVAGIEEDEQLASLPYAIMPVEQPIMMVNYPSRAPIHLRAP